MRKLTMLGTLLLISAITEASDSQRVVCPAKVSVQPVLKEATAGFSTDAAVISFSSMVTQSAPRNSADTLVTCHYGEFNLFKILKCAPDKVRVTKQEASCRGGRK